MAAKAKNLLRTKKTPPIQAQLSRNQIRLSGF
jgi:hypothetical protein